MGWVLNATPRTLYPRKKPGAHCVGGLVGPRAGLGSCGKFATNGIRSLDRPARSESLYRLSYLCPNKILLGTADWGIGWVCRRWN